MPLKSLHTFLRGKLLDLELAALDQALLGHELRRGLGSHKWASSVWGSGFRVWGLGSTFSFLIANSRELVPAFFAAFFLLLRSQWLLSGHAEVLTVVCVCGEEGMHEGGGEGEGEGSGTSRA